LGTEVPLGLFLLKTQPSNEHLSVAGGDGYLWCYPLFTGSGSLDKRIFIRSIRLPAQLSAAGLLLIFGATFYRSPDETKILGTN
jgi:hypothetical protein